MIVIDTSKITGKEVYKLVVKAVKERQKQSPGQRITRFLFCEESGLHRTTLNHFRHGGKPGADALLKVAGGLKKWGFDVRIEA